MTLNVSNQYVPHVHDCILLQSDLDVLSSWIGNWKVMFNETKCSLLSIVISMSAEQNDYQYLINNLSIPFNQQIDLGITVSSDLSWPHHISK